MSNVFQKIGHFFAAVVHFVISDAGRAKIAHYLEEAQRLLAPALDAVSGVAAVTSTRTDDEIIALVKKYGLGTVTPDMLTNNATIAGLLKRAAIVELRRTTGSTLPGSVLDLAIQSAYVVYKQAKEDMSKGNTDPDVLAPLAVPGS